MPRRHQCQSRAPCCIAPRWLAGPQPILSRSPTEPRESAARRRAVARLDLARRVLRVRQQADVARTARLRQPLSVLLGQRPVKGQQLNERAVLVAAVGAAEAPPRSSMIRLQPR